MNKKILICSILSVVILILVSFTSVVGYNSIESDKKLSPLFNVRSKRAIKEDNQDLSCEFVGKGEEIDFFIPKRIDGISPFMKFIYSLIKINEKVHNPNINNIIQQFIHNDIIEIEQISELEDKIYNPLASTMPPTGFACCVTAGLSLCKLFMYMIVITLCIAVVLNSLVNSLPSIYINICKQP